MRETDESDDQWKASTSASRSTSASDDVGLADDGLDADSGAAEGTEGVADVFESGPLDPAVVEASVDALFERFEEDSPEEVMLADRFPDETDVVPAPPAFDEFADDVGLDEDAADEAVLEFAAPEAGGRAFDDLPNGEDVVGFEEAPDPATERPANDVTRVDDATSANDETTSGDGTESFEEDIEESEAFEWVTEPVVTETVLADPEEASSFAGEAEADEDSSAGVLSDLRSSFPF